MHLSRLINPSLSFVSFWFRVIETWLEVVRRRNRFFTCSLWPLYVPPRWFSSRIQLGKLIGAWSMHFFHNINFSQLAWLKKYILCINSEGMCRLLWHLLHFWKNVFSYSKHKQVCFQIWVPMHNTNNTIKIWRGNRSHRPTCIVDQFDRVLQFYFWNCLVDHMGSLSGT